MKLSADQLRWVRLTRTGLASAFPSIPAAVSALVGVQAQEFPAACVSLCLRLPRDRGTSGADVERHCVEVRDLVRVWTVRGTLHVVTAAQWPLVYSALLLPTQLSPFAKRVRTQFGDDDGVQELFRRGQDAALVAMKKPPVPRLFSREEVTEAVQAAVTATPPAAKAPSARSTSKSEYVQAYRQQLEHPAFFWRNVPGQLCWRGLVCMAGVSATTGCAESLVAPPPAGSSRQAKAFNAFAARDVWVPDVAAAWVQVRLAAMAVSGDVFGCLMWWLRWLCPVSCRTRTPTRSCCCST